MAGSGEDEAAPGAGGPEGLPDPDSLLRVVVSHAPVVLFALDAQGRFTLSDGAGLAALGLSPGEVVGASAFELYAEYPPVCEHIRRALSGEELGGTVQVAGRWFMTHYAPQRDARGRPAGAVGVATDVTSLHEARHDLRESEERFRELYERTPVMLHSIDRQGRLVSVSDRWCQVLGYSREEVLGRPSADFLTEASARYAREVILPAFFRTGRCADIPYQLVKKDGHVVDVLLSAIAERDAQGQVHRSVAVLIDVSEQKRMRAQLVHADRMVSLGLLAAGVAHEINNPLSYVMTTLDYLAGLLDQAALPKAQELVRAARSGTERVRRIVEDLRIFSRPGPEQVGPVDVNRVLESVLELAQGELRHGVHVERDLEAVPPVLASDARLGQVFLNLVLNAAQAVRAAGRADGVVRIRSRPSPEGAVVVSVTDDGVGISREHRERIFDPFFSTKPVGQGSGLGLSICHGIVHALGGEIHVESASGQGATFEVVLPAIAGGVASPAPEAPPAVDVALGPSEERPRLLIVDDDRAVATSLQMVLEEEFAVTVAGGGQEAVERCRAETFDAVLCDVLMPDMVGVEVHAALRRVQPGLEQRMLFMTGAFAADERLLPTGALVLQKPFSLDQVRAALQRIVARGRAAR